MTDILFGEGWNWATVEMGLLRVLYSFPAGVLIYKLYQKKVWNLSIPSPVVIVIFIAFIMLPPTWGVPFSILIGFPILVFLAANSEPKGILAYVFASLGAASYAIYAIHHGFIDAVFSKLGFPLGIQVDVVLMCLIVPICMLVDKFYDTPSRRYLTRMLLRRSRTPYFGIRTKTEPAANSLAKRYAISLFIR